MIRGRTRCIVVLLLAALGACLPVPVLAQARGAAGGGPPPGIPAVPPPGIPAGPPQGMGAGGAGGIMGAGPPPGVGPGLPGQAASGPPAWAAPQAHDHFDTQGPVELPRSQRLARPERQRAKALETANPARFELDRNGALAIRGEILATGLDRADLARIARAGFSVLRRDRIAGLGTTLTVLMRTGLSGERALKTLRRIAPHAQYALNHVLFESGARANSAMPPTDKGAPGGRRRTRVGMIDTGVAADVAASPRIRLVAHDFAAGKSPPELHGTAVAQLLSREGGPVTIYSADIFGSDPNDGTSEMLIRALGWMADQRVPVINVSLVGPANPIVGAITERLIGEGYTIVAPVGNDGRAAKLLYPASYPGVIAVSATGSGGHLLPEASRVKRVDFAAPGIATVNGVSGQSTVVRGTSFAAPVVSRLLADRIAEPNRSEAQRAIRLLAQHAKRPRKDGRWYGHGIVE